MDENVKMNVWLKLIMARQRFLAGGVDKSGKNSQLEFKYFELNDIVPKVTDIFVDMKLLGVTNFSDTEATLTVINCENPEETIVFSSPMRFVEPNRGTNPLMALGASHTYMRRYMYMLAMDVCEPDQIDSGAIGGTAEPEEAAPAAPKSRRKKPATPKEREAIKEELAGADEPISDLQKEALLNACNALLDKDPEQEEFVQELAVKTDGFTKLTKSECEAIINAINEMLTKYGE